MTMTNIQLRVNTVLDRIKDIVLEDSEFAQFMLETLEDSLTEYHMQDGFGTEGQCDPRGDFRDGDWSMDRVEGIDDE